MTSPDPILAQRQRWIFATADRQGLGLEVGASHKPTVSREDGFQVEYLDHATREELVAKYSGHGVDLDRIPEVDHVWRGEPYPELVGGTERYDWVIACHVLEHTPDRVRFLKDCEAILKPGGVLCLVLPDMRRCFDALRFPTGLAEVCQAHDLENSRHDGAVLYEAHVTALRLAGRTVWDHSTTGSSEPVHTGEQAAGVAAAADATQEYMDAHRWAFTPHSLRGLVEDLHALGHSGLREVACGDTVLSEFFLALKKGGSGPGVPRFQLAQEAHRELAEAHRTRSSPLHAYLSRFRHALRRRLGGS